MVEWIFSLYPPLEGMLAEFLSSFWGLVAGLGFGVLLLLALVFVLTEE